MSDRSRTLRFLTSGLVVGCWICGLATAASAEEGRDPVAEPEPPAAEAEGKAAGAEGKAGKRAATRVVSLTLSPIHFLLPAVELTGEVSLGRTLPLSVAAIGAYGWPEGTADDGVTKRTLNTNVVELGTQVTYYPWRNFRTVQLGAELLYIHVGCRSSISDTHPTGHAASWRTAS